MAKKPAEIPEHEQVILEPELEEALKNATDAEMCDIAGSDAPVTVTLRLPPREKRLLPRGHAGLFSVRITVQINTPSGASVYFLVCDMKANFSVASFICEGLLAVT